MSVSKLKNKINKSVDFRLQPNNNSQIDIKIKDKGKKSVIKKMLEKSHLLK